jgi:hypothetical protein
MAEPTGYHRAPTYPPGGQAPFWYVPPQPEKKRTLDVLKDVASIVSALVVIASIIFGGGKAWEKLSRLEQDSIEQKAKAAQWEQRLNLMADKADKSDAAMSKKLNEVLERVNVTNHRRARPEQ